MKIPRNEPCPCLSGKKYKKCCDLKEKLVTSGTWFGSHATDLAPVLSKEIQESLFAQCNLIIDQIYEGNIEQQAQVVQDLHAANPKHDYVNYTTGIYYIKINQPNLAVACFEQAIRVYPLFAEAYYNLAQAYLMQDDIVSTVACLKKVLEIERMDSQNKELTKAAQEMLAGLDDVVRKEFSCSLSEHVQFVELIKRAETCALAGKTKKAQELFEQVVALKPDCVEAYENLAMLYYQAEQKDKAMACLTKLFELDPAKMVKYFGPEQDQAMQDLPSEKPVESVQETSQL